MHEWPVVLRDGDLHLRPLRRSDRREFTELRARNAQYVQPWDAVDPERPTADVNFSHMRYAHHDNGRRGTSITLLVLHRGTMVGQVSAGPIRYGAMRTAMLGYWIDQSHTGHGLATWSAALLTDYLFAELGMNRVEATVHPHNMASRKVVQKLGMQSEGIRRSAIFVDGAFQDHEVFAVIRADLMRNGRLVAIRDELLARHAPH